jgi:flagellar biosynthesis/type III secretory pathway ATPase
LVEVAGATTSGSITMIASVLSDGDERDPVSDAARSLLDGHIVLSPVLANAGRFPSVDPLLSASRTMSCVVSPAHRRAAHTVRGALALLERTEDARRLGIESSDARTRRAIAEADSIDAFFRQDGPADPVETVHSLRRLAERLERP